MRKILVDDYDDDDGGGLFSRFVGLDSGSAEVCVWSSSNTLEVFQIINDPGDRLLSRGAHVTCKVHEIQELLQHLCHD